MRTITIEISDKEYARLKRLTTLWSSKQDDIAVSVEASECMASGLAHEEQLHNLPPIENEFPSPVVHESANAATAPASSNSGGGSSLDTLSKPQCSSGQNPEQAVSCAGREDNNGKCGAPYENDAGRAASGTNEAGDAPHPEPLAHGASQPSAVMDDGGGLIIACCAMGHRLGHIYPNPVGGFRGYCPECGMVQLASFEMRLNAP